MHTCTKAHSGTVGTCVYCERDALRDELRELRKTYSELVTQMKECGICGEPTFDGARCKRTAFVQGETRQCAFDADHEGDHQVGRHGTTPFRWRT